MRLQSFPSTTDDHAMPTARRRRTWGWVLLLGGIVVSGPALARDVPFVEQTPITTAADIVTDVTTADIDGDGDLDAVSAAFHDDAISWYENDGGAGTWTPHIISDTVVQAWAVNVADLDRDGDLDVLSTSYHNGGVAWHENGGAGGSWTMHPIAAPYFKTIDVVAADVDDDGDLDVLAVYNNNNTIIWYENDGTAGGWASHTVTTTASGVNEVATGDVDRDGDPDILSASLGDSTVAWYENDGAGGTWSRHLISDSVAAATKVDVADVDGDGDLDALSGSYDNDAVYWHANDGSGGGWTRHTISTGVDANGLRAADVDGDGDVDAISASFGQGVISWHENDDAGTVWTRHILSNTAPQSNAVDAADLDGDGDLDVLSASGADDTIDWYRNETIGRSAWFPTRSILTSTEFNVVFVRSADLDRDGDLDALYTTSDDHKIVWRENDGSQWIRHIVSSDVHPIYDCLVEDLDDDGDLDILVNAGDPQQIAWFENDGMGAGWMFHTIHDPVDSIYGVHPADLDGDGDSDLIFSLPSGLEWLENDNGNASTWTVQTLFPGNLASTSKPADLDGDGDLDVVSTFFDTITIRWFENVNGDASAWSDHNISDETSALPELEIVDVEGDGDLDVVSTHSERWFENDGAATTWVFHSFASYTTTTRAVRAADLDLDGDVDMLTGGLYDGVDWHESDGTGLNWTPHRDYSIADSHVFDISLADVDRDGDPDFFYSRPEYNTLALAENLGGQVSVETTLLAPTVLFQGATDAIFSVEVTHLGRTIDSSAELATLELLIEEQPGVPLTTPDANALIERLEVHRDDGDGAFDPGLDELVTSIDHLVLADGRLTVQLPDGAPGCEIQNGSPALFFVVAQATADASTQSPNFLIVTHLTDEESGLPNSKVEDRDHDIELLLQWAPNVTTSPVLFGDPGLIFSDGFETGNTLLWSATVG